MIRFTDEARKWVRRQLDRAGVASGGVRISLSPDVNEREAGYIDLVMAAEPVEGDEVMEIDGLRVFVEPGALPLVAADNGVIEAADIGHLDGVAGGRIAAEPVMFDLPYPDGVSRWSLLTRWVVAIPLYIGLAFWAGWIGLVVFLAFWAILFTRTIPAGLFGQVEQYLRFQFRLAAYFPYFLSPRPAWGKRGPLLDYEVSYPAHLSRLALVLLKLPLFMSNVTLSLTFLVECALTLLAIPAWLALLVTGSYPRRLFVASTSLLEWVARIHAWQYLLRDDAVLFGRKQTTQAMVAVGVVVVLLIQYGGWSPLMLPGGEGLREMGASWMSAAIPIKREGEEAMRTFMEAGRGRDVEAGVALSSAPEGQRVSEVAALFGERRLFEDYESLYGTEFHWRTGPEFAVLELYGVVRYRGGARGAFSAVLEKKDASWKVRVVRLERP
jgi:hypothetical protein